MGNNSTLIIIVICVLIIIMKTHINYFNKIAKKGLKTDLNLKRFPKFSNRISGSSSGTIILKFKITALYFGSQEILTAAHMPLGTPFFHSQSSCQCFSVKIPEKFCACN